MKTFRVYLNRFEEAPLIWSVDEGEIGTERKVKDVIMSNCTGITKTDLKADNVGNPKAWLHVIAEELMVSGDNIAVLRG